MFLKNNKIKSFFAMSKNNESPVERSKMGWDYNMCGEWNDE